MVGKPRRKREFQRRREGSGFRLKQQVVVARQAIFSVNIKALVLAKDILKKTRGFADFRLKQQKVVAGLDF